MQSIAVRIQNVHYYSLLQYKVVLIISVQYNAVQYTVQYIVHSTVNCIAFVFYQESIDSKINSIIYSYFNNIKYVLK